MAEATGQSLDADTLATLKQLGLLGAVDGEAKLSCAELAERLEVSNQTASRRLQRLERSGTIEREIVSDGQWIEITDDGQRRLRHEYDAYRRIFEGPSGVELVGTVTSGMGEGRHYITLPGYMAQFEEKLGYAPYAGTLNLELDPESVRTRARLSSAEPIVIEGWEDDERTYGPAYCYPTSIENGAGVEYEEAHVITPERTHHGEDQLELIAPDRLRDELSLTDGDEVIAHVTE